MAATPESEARALVRRARRAALIQAVARSLGRGLTAGALLALAASAGVRLFGGAPGPWLLFAFVPAAALAGLGLLRSRPDDVRAAILLDAAGATKERFLAVLAADDPEVRDLSARQALERTAGGFPLSFPPSTEGLAAVISLVALAAFLLLVPAPAPTPTAAGGGDPSGPSPLASAGEPAIGPGPDAAPPRESPASPAETTVRRLASGEDLTEEEWSRLESEGVTGEDRAAAEAALADGDPEAAAEALRAALARAAADPPEAAPAAGSPEAGWDAYSNALARPAFRPEYDDVVRRYFDETARRGLR